MNKTKKVLVLGAHSRHPYKVGMLGEVLKVQFDNKENEVRFLDCDNAVGGYCALNKSHGRMYCKKCLVGSNSVMDWMGFPKENIIKMISVKSPKFPEFKTLEDLKHFEIEGHNAGISVVTSIMSLTRDFSFEPSKYKKDIQGFLTTEYITLKNFQRIYEEFPFEELHTFNGRFALPYMAVQFCKNKGIDFYLYEGANGKPTKYDKVKNRLMHEMNMFRDAIDESWKTSNPSTRDKIAEKWYQNRRDGRIQDSFTAEQKQHLLPKNFDNSKENIMIFNSSLDEYYAFDDWKNPLTDNENEIVEYIFEKYKNDNSKHFYLRIHPNLADAKRKNALQIQEINKLKNKNYKNVTIIEPKDKIDSYSLIDAANKVITFISTVGIEATFWNKPSILAGQAMYDRLNCVYQAKNFDELSDLIDKDLPPIARETTYPYAYHNATYGTEYKTYIPYRHNDGEFMGHSVKILENPINEFIKGYIFHRFKVVKTVKKERVKAD